MTYVRKLTLFSHNKFTLEFYHSNFIINTNGISSKFTIDHNRELKFLDVEVAYRISNVSFQKFRRLSTT
jgi:hypothetical protein